jgi:hypothetical protein
MSLVYDIRRVSIPTNPIRSQTRPVLVFNLNMRKKGGQENGFFIFYFLQAYVHCYVCS